MINWNTCATGKSKSYMFRYDSFRWWCQSNFFQWCKDWIITTSCVATCWQTSQCSVLTGCRATSLSLDSPWFSLCLIWSAGEFVSLYCFCHCVCKIILQTSLLTFSGVVDFVLFHLITSKNYSYSDLFITFYNLTAQLRAHPTLNLNLPLQCIPVSLNLKLNWKKFELSKSLSQLWIENTQRGIRKGSIYHKVQVNHVRAKQDALYFKLLLFLPKRSIKWQTISFAQNCGKKGPE